MQKRDSTGITHPLKTGFSLVELSVVLIIVALLAGGVMTGSNLIHAARLKNVITEATDLRDAVRTFQDIYGGYPGDLPNATSIWGIRAGTGNNAVCYSTPAIDERTCNGDGNLGIGSTTRHEYYLFWQHLANAGLISGKFTGTAGPGGDSHHVIGENSPASGFPNTGWSIPHYTTTAGNTAVWARTEVLGHTPVIGAQTTTTFTTGRAFSVQDAHSVDKKMDDGMPGIGHVQILYWTECTTATAPTQLNTARYALDNQNKNQCAIIFPYTINIR